MTIQKTSIYQFPFPQLGDPSNVPSDLSSLAQRMEAVLQTLESGYLPIGGILMWASGTPPSRWIMCQGQTLDQVGAYAALFNVIGSSYNVGTVATGKFMLPDLQGRVPVGVDGSAGRLSANDVLGASGGEERHKLLTAEMPIHHHTGVNHQHSGPSHTHTVSGSAASSGAHTHGSQGGQRFMIESSTGYDLNAGTQMGATPATNFAGAHTHTVSGTAAAAGTGLTGAAGALDTTGVGGDGDHLNMQPFQVVNFVIRFS